MKCFQNLVQALTWIAAGTLAIGNVPVCRAGGDEGLSGLPSHNDGPPPDDGLATFVFGPHSHRPSVPAAVESGPEQLRLVVTATGSVEQSGSSIQMDPYVLEPAEEGLVVTQTSAEVSVQGHFVVQHAALAGGALTLQSGSGKGAVVLWVGTRDTGSVVAPAGILESFQQIGPAVVLPLPASGLDVRKLMAVAERYVGHDPRFSVGFAVLERTGNGTALAFGSFTLGDGAHRVEFEIP